MILTLVMNLNRIHYRLLYCGGINWKFTTYTNCLKPSKMRRIAHLLFFTFLSQHSYSSVLADIAPDPTIAKGIIPTHPVDIQMVSEIVKAKLTLDSAYVECTFHMHNLGNQTNLEVGFPVMNYYMWQNEEVSPIDQNKFEVFVNGRSINKMDTY